LVAVILLAAVLIALLLAAAQLVLRLASYRLPGCQTLGTGRLSVAAWPHRLLLLWSSPTSVLLFKLMQIILICKFIRYTSASQHNFLRVFYARFLLRYPQSAQSGGQARGAGFGGGAPVRVVADSFAGGRVGVVNAGFISGRFAATTARF
jgi:hypothetical protein